MFDEAICDCAGSICFELDAQGRGITVTCSEEATVWEVTARFREFLAAVGYTRETIDKATNPDVDTYAITGEPYTPEPIQGCDPDWTYTNNSFNSAQSAGPTLPRAQEQAWKDPNPTAKARPSCTPTSGDYRPSGLDW